MYGVASKSPSRNSGFPPPANSSFTMATCPASAASCRGVRSLLFTSLTRQPLDQDNRGHVALRLACTSSRDHPLHPHHALDGPRDLPLHPHPALDGPRGSPREYLWGNLGWAYLLRKSCTSSTWPSLAARCKGVSPLLVWGQREGRRTHSGYSHIPCIPHTLRQTSSHAQLLIVRSLNVAASCHDSSAPHLSVDVCLVLKE